MEASQVNNDFVYLQVIGKSQLQKEIEETNHLRNKCFEEAALFRNEETGSVEENYQNLPQSVLVKSGRRKNGMKITLS